MRKRIGKVLLLFFLWVIMPLLVAELFLQTTDPLGAGRYANDILTLLHTNRPDPRGYALPTGEYQLSNWKATILEDHTRYIPDNHPDAPTTITLVGDSVTFGLGVNDNEVYANVLAQHCPDVNFVNAAVVGHNIDNLSKSFDIYNESDAFVWLGIYNDGQYEIPTIPRPRTMTYIQAYLLPYFTPPEEDTTPPERQQYYLDRVRSILANYPVILVVLDSQWGHEFREEIPEAHMILHYTRTNSKTDAHPNAEGHRQIAAGILPLLSEFGCTPIEDD